MTDPNWIEFVEIDRKPKTVVWAVMSKDTASHVGFVQWHGPWRKYCFFPEFNTIFEWDCMRSIAEFCEQKTKEHREARQGA
jgi:hypothetical protein